MAQPATMASAGRHVHYSSLMFSVLLAALGVCVQAAMWPTMASDSLNLLWPAQDLQVVHQPHLMFTVMLA
jgi:hypothetical protein